MGCRGKVEWKIMENIDTIKIKKTQACRPTKIVQNGGRRRGGVHKIDTYKNAHTRTRALAAGWGGIQNGLEIKKPKKGVVVVVWDSKSFFFHAALAGATGALNGR